MSFKQEGPRLRQTPKEEVKRDPYEVLGLVRGASEAEVKAAWKKAMKIAHPDQGGTTKHAQEVNESYQILGDNDKRALYDRYGTAYWKIMESGQAPPTPRDPLAEIFGKPKRRTSAPTDGREKENVQRETASTKQEQPKPKEPEKLSPEIIRSRAIYAARTGAVAYEDLMRKMIAEKQSFPAELISDPEIVDTVFHKAINTAHRGGYDYGLFMKAWSSISGFDRAKIDSSEQLLDIATKSLVSDVPHPTMFKNNLQNWEKANPVITRGVIFDLLEIRDAFRKEADKARQKDSDDGKRYGSSQVPRDQWFKKFLKYWDEVGIDVALLGIKRM